MSITTWIDANGRAYAVEPVDGNDNPETWPVIGPPPGLVDALLPEPHATRLHNELHRRGMFRLADFQRRPAEVQAALMATFKIDTQVIVAQMVALEKAGG